MKMSFFKNLYAQGYPNKIDKMDQKQKQKIYVHTGYKIEGLLLVVEYFSNIAKSLSPKKPLELRNQFAIHHIDRLKEMRDIIYTHDILKSAERSRAFEINKRSKIIKELSDKLPEITDGFIVSYIKFDKIIDKDRIYPFIGICVRCSEGDFYTVLYDNGNNSLYKSKLFMIKHSEEFIKICEPIKVKLVRYVLTDSSL
jgi:hypothetical protein